MTNDKLEYDPNELVDVYDEFGVLTGEVVTKTEAKSKLLYHKAVHIWIINEENEVLIQKRNETKKIFPGLWDISVAGHLTSRELPMDIAAEEIEQELGFTIDREKLIYLYCLRREFKTFGTSNMFFDTFLYKTNKKIEEMIINPREISELKYVDITEIEKIVNEESDLAFAPRSIECKMIIENLKCLF